MNPLKIATLSVLVAAISVAQAVPLLQLYAEGATYDTEQESWVFTDTDGGPIDVRVWVIGNVAGPGSKGTIASTCLRRIPMTPGPVSTSQCPDPRPSLSWASVEQASV